MSGNEAIATGAFRASALFGSGYPGTPSSEILEFFSKFNGVEVQWASNEKSGFEMALGASIAGVRSFVTMKHVGLNVAADPFMTASYTGINAGFVVVTADDPSMHSSQNEQDNRFFGKFASVPVIEPSNSTEAMAYTQMAFALSERFDVPVMLRSTTRVSHSLSVVEYSNPTQHKVKKPLHEDFRKYVMLPSNARLRRKNLLEREKLLEEYAEETPLNRIEKGTSRIGIITGGIAYTYAKELAPHASFFKIGLMYPLPINKIKEFLETVEQAIVIEELEPFIEEELKSHGIKIEGKVFFPRDGELNLNRVEEGLQKAGILNSTPTQRLQAFELPQRPPSLCPGCPHRPIFDILHSLNVYVTGDIGCYTLGALPPLSSIHTTLCMGASISMGCGISRFEKEKKVVAVIGDSTFFHTGIQPLIDAYLSGTNLTVIVLDNSITAMTGGQPNPSSGFSINGNPTARINIAKIARAIGIKHVFEVDQFKYSETKKIIEREINHNGLSVIVTKRPCALMPKKIKSSPLAINDKCINCKRCLRIGCSAIKQGETRPRIDTSMCTGCGVCKEVCPIDGAIVEEQDD